MCEKKTAHFGVVSRINQLALRAQSGMLGRTAGLSSEGRHSKKQDTPSGILQEGPGWAEQPGGTHGLPCSCSNLAGACCSPSPRLVRACRPGGLKATPGDEQQHLTRLLCKQLAESWAAQYFRQEPWVGCLSDSVLLSEGSARAAALSLLVAEDFALQHAARQRPEAKECKD